MPAPARRNSTGEHDSREIDVRWTPATAVSMHNTRPERSVFVEENNPDGWISTDLTVDPER